MRRNSFKLLIALTLVLLTSQIVAAQTSSDSEAKVVEFVVIADTANLRTGAGTNFPVADRVVKGDSLLIYDEEPETSGWLRVYREGEDDAFIADYLVERAPMRFYPVDQEPTFTVTGTGKAVTEIFEIPRGIYRVDAVIADNAFILKSIVVEGECRDDVIFNEIALGSRELEISGLFISSGCSVIFETDNVDRDWEFALRDAIVSEEFLLENILYLNEQPIISGTGRSLTMPTYLPTGIWTITAEVADNAFILTAHILDGDCDNGTVLNEFQSSSENMSLSTVYRSSESGCIIYWETSNVDQDWEISFEKLR